MPLNEADKVTILAALQKSAAALEAINIELDKIKVELYKILDDIRD